jgi:hypothetical protein
VTMFDLRGTEEQRAITQAAIDRSDFPYERLAPQLRSESGRDRIVIGWADLATQPRQLARQHGAPPGRIGTDPQLRNRVLGEAWTDGLIRIDVSVESDPELAAEVILSELAHQVDFHYLDDSDRAAIYDVYHAPDAPEHEHGWFDVGAYEEWVGESLMSGFTRAYSDVAITLTQFVHQTTDDVARKVRRIITPDLGPPPWDPDPGPVVPELDQPPQQPPETTLGDLLARLLQWLRRLFGGGR